ncbi:MAG: hypothetical protein RR543_02955 [Erysipelotrichales bacterium]
MYAVDARTVWYFYINALIREYIAHLWIHKKANINFVCTTILLILALHFLFAYMQPELVME